MFKEIQIMKINMANVTILIGAVFKHYVLVFEMKYGLCRKKIRDEALTDLREDRISKSDIVLSDLS